MHPALRAITPMLEVLKMTLYERKWEALHARLGAFDRLTDTIDDLVEAHNAYLGVCNASCEERDDGTFATDAEVDAAIDARADVIMELIAAQMAFWRAHIPAGDGAGEATRRHTSLPLEPTSPG
jgi:hypothetical protein